MASTLNIVICAALAAILWTGIGLPIAQRIAPRSLAWPIAPILGWAVHSAAMLPALRVVGLSRMSVCIALGLPLIAAIVVLARQKPPSHDANPAIWIWPALGAAAVALIPACAILPKFVADGVTLAAPIFDHSKIALIDEIARLGLPPGNPFFGGSGVTAGLPYYYLWHFSAAELAVLLGFSGWEADAALTWFTAFAALMLMIALATWASGRVSTAIWVLLLTLAGSVRPTLAAFVDSDTLMQWLGWHFSGLSGLLFQSSWAPQHVASAACVVLAIIVMSRLAQAGSVLAVTTFALVVAAGFGSSTWVGGVLFALAAPVCGLVMLERLKSGARLAFTLKCALAGVITLALAYPLLRDQFVATAMRLGGPPIVIHPYEVWGTAVPEMIRRILDPPSYWLVLLVIEFPAIYLAGTFALAGLLADKTLKPENKDVLVPLAALAVTSLIVTWLLVSKVGSNNDLGWRAVLPAIVILTAGASAGLTRWIAMPSRRGVAIAALCLAVLGIPDGWGLIRSNAIAEPNEQAKQFSQAPALWAAVRKHAAPDDRVGNNPLFLKDMTPWPANISWALMANRRSCYAGWELALAFVPLPEARRKAIDDQFTRVFAGTGTSDDVQDLAFRYGCRIIVVSNEDGAWARDPFAGSPIYRLLETDPGRWRIYGRVGYASN